jgi:TonB family protein
MSIKLAAAFLAVSTSCVDAVSAQKPRPIPDKDGIYAGWNGVRVASLLHAVPAVLPDGSDLKSTKHTCALLVTVDADGSLRKVVLANRTTSPFDNVAISAVKQSQFEAGTLNGNPVPTQFMVYVPFLGGGEPAIPLGASSPGKKPLKSLKPPVPIYSPDAEFSDLARRAHYQGLVAVRVLIDEDGLPRSAGLLAEVGQGLDENALSAVHKYRFKPATLEGSPVPFVINVEINLAVFEW